MVIRENLFLQELINNKYKGSVRWIVRETSNIMSIDNSKLNIEKLVGDIDDSDFIDSVMNVFDTVMHIYNIHHLPTIVQSAIKNKTKRVILVHTTGIYSEFKYASEGYKKIEQKIKELKSDINVRQKSLF